MKVRIGDATYNRENYSCGNGNVAMEIQKITLGRFFSFLVWCNKSQINQLAWHARAALSVICTVFKTSTFSKYHWRGGGGQYMMGEIFVDICCCNCTGAERPGLETPVCLFFCSFVFSKDLSSVVGKVVVCSVSC